MNAWVRPLRAANIRKRSNGLTNACRHPSPKIKNKSRHAAGSPGPPGASAPINVSTLASVESLRHAIERCAQTGGKESARWRQQYLVTTVAYRVAKITIPFRRCKKKKKKRERGKNKNKKKKNRNRIRVGRRAVSFLAFHAISTGNELRRISAKRI